MGNGARTVAAGMTAALLLLSGGTAAWADESSGGPTPAPGPITLTPQQSAWVCTQRIPSALRRIDGLTTRASGDATVPGSTAWLQRREDDARAAGRGDLADRLQRRIDGRPAALDRLARLRDRVVGFQQEHCS